MTIRRLIVRQLIVGVILLFVVSALTFVLVALIPGNAAQSILGSNATPAQYAALNAQLGLDRPLWAQYATWLGHAVHGNLGTSLMAPQPVTSLLNADLNVTLPLAIGAAAVSLIVGVALGSVAAIRGGLLARLTDLAGLICLALPVFWVALLLGQLFGVKLHWLPATGFVALSTSPADWLRSLILPVAALAIGGIAAVSKQTRDSVDGVLRQDFIQALRVDGIPAARVTFLHTLRNAAIPVIAVSGIQFVAVLGGAVIIENVFALPGLGSTVVTAAIDHDLPVLVGAAVYFCVLVVIVSLVVDVAFIIVNPKVRTAHEH